MVSSISSSTDSLTALQQLLKEADADGDSVISSSELTNALSSDSDAAEALVTAADTDGDGAMSLTEFTNFADRFSADTGMALLSAQESYGGLNSLFTSMDSDGSATVTAAEITASLTAVDDSVTTVATATEETESTDTATTSTTATGTSVTTDIDDLLATVDTNGDGVFDKNDVALAYLAAEREAAKKDNGEPSDSKLFTAAKSALDTDKDGVVSDEEKAAYGLA